MLKYLFSFFSCFNLVLFFSFSVNANDNNVLLFNNSPKKIENLKLEDVNGKIKSLNDLNSNFFILNFWATWCPPCIKEIPDLIKLEKKFNKKFKIIFISVDSVPKKTITKFMKKNKFKKFQTFIDQNFEISKKLEVKVMPTSIIVDSNLNEISRVEGYINWLDEKVIKTLEKL